MAAAEYTVTISRPPQDVYAFLADGLNNFQWRSEVRSISLASGEPGAVGAVYAQRLSGPGGTVIDGDYEITEAHPGEALRFQVVAGPARPRGVFLLEPRGEGTAVTFALEFEPEGLMKLMGGLIQKTMDQEVRQLEKLKALLERTA